MTTNATAYALVAEQGPEPQKCIRANWHQAIVVDKVKSISADMVGPILEKLDFACILVGGGSPCQPNSWMNTNRKGLVDPGRSIHST